MGALLAPVIALVVLGVLLEALEGAMPAVPRMREQWRTDLAWWFFGPVVKPFVQGGLIVAMIPPLLALGIPLDDKLVQGHGPLAGLPWWVQLAAVFLTIDFVGYWTHRLHHRSILWHTHAIHHSSEHLDWLASVRVHPFNTLMQRAPGLLLVLLLGFDLRTVAVVAPVLGIYGLIIHANVPLRFGPLAWVFVTPTFHRWHHARDGAPDDGCNFSGLFPVWDWLFGTLHMPQRQPVDFGVRGEAPDESFWQQLWWPVRG